MAKQILFATSNPHKKARFQAYFEPLGLDVISFSDINSQVDVVEDGKTPKENALKKAMAGYLATGKPTFGVDYWLRIEGLPEDQQPGPHVRRIFVGSDNQRIEATDEQMLSYYINKIRALGGRTKGVWTSAIALVVGQDRVFVESFSRETTLTSERSPNKTKGEPLNSIQIDPKSKKYFTDLTTAEWLNLQKEREKGYIDFMREHLREI